MPRLIDLGYKWYARYHKIIDNYYVQCNQFDNGKHIVVTLHQYIMNCFNGSPVDHKEPTQTLDNRKSNLRVVEHSDNSANRKGANKNNKTGARNVHLCKIYGGEYIYKVQIMKKGEKFCWEFGLNKFDEACKFAEQKRKEIFGEFAGNG